MRGNIRIIVLFLFVTILLSSCAGVSHEAAAPKGSRQVADKMEKSQMETQDAAEPSVSKDQDKEQPVEGGGGFAGGRGEEGDDVESLEKSNLYDADLKRRTGAEIESFQLEETIEEEKEEMKEEKPKEMEPVMPAPSDEIARAIHERDFGTREEEKEEAPGKKSTMAMDYASEVPEGIKEEVSIQKFRVRSRFPEILFYNPGIITDEFGSSGLAFQAGDAITEYTLGVQAASMQGEWGYGETSFKTFQTFFIEFTPPSRLHLDDRVEMSAAIFNYMDKAISVEVLTSSDENLEINRLGSSSIRIASRKVVEYPVSIKATGLGVGRVSITAKGDGIHDSIRREIKILPSLPENSYNKSGVLNSGTNEIEIKIPENAITLDNDFQLRIYSDPLQGVLPLIRKIELKPHASLSRASALLIASCFANKQLQDQGLLTDKLKDELDKAIDTSWLRILSFRTPDGFSFYPGGNTDRFAGLLALDTLLSLKEVREIDEELEKQLVENASVMFPDQYYPDGDRLYAAMLLLESGKINPYMRNSIEDYVESPLFNTSLDPSFIGLSCRCKALLGKNLQASDKISRFSMNRATNIQTMIPTQRGVPSVLNVNDTFGIANFLLAIAHSNEEIDSSQLNELINRMENDIWDDNLSPFDNVNALVSVSNIRESTPSKTGLESVKLSGKDIEISSELIVNEAVINLKSGINLLTIETESSNLSYQILGKYFSKESLAQEPFDIEFNFAGSPDDDRSVNAEFTILNPLVTNNETIVSIPLPPGVRPLDKPRSLAKRVNADYVQTREGEITFYFRRQISTDDRKYSIPMVAEFDGTFYLEAPRIENDTGILSFTSQNPSRINWL